MPRRQATVEREVPLLLVPPMIMKRIRQHGEAVQRIIVRRTWRHFYNISIRTTTVNRELKPRVRTPRAVPPSVAVKEREQV